jgi:hypothetical protein
MSLLIDLNNELFDVFSIDFLGFWFHDNDRYVIPIQTDMENLKKNEGKAIYKLDLLFTSLFNDICSYVMKRLNNSVPQRTYMDEITIQLYNLRQCVKNDIITIRSHQEHKHVVEYIYDYHVKQLFNLLEIISEYENEKSD